MQRPSSVFSFYISKENIGVVHFCRDDLRMQCGMIQYYVPTSKQLFQATLSQRKTQLILTNNDKHHFFSNFINNIRIVQVDQRGLQDDIIQNNLNLFRFNPTKKNIHNKAQYIKLMREHSEGCGLGKEKYKSLGIMLYYLLNQDDFSISSKLYLNDISYLFDRIFKNLIISNSQLQKIQIIKEQVHPSLIKGKGRSKQGFSVLSLYQSTLSSAGSKRILRNLFRNPSYDKRKLQQRLHLITWMKQFNSQFKNLIRVFKTLHGVDTILRKFVDSRVQSEDWRKLVRTLESMIVLHKTMQQKARLHQLERLPVFLQVFFKNINWPQIAKVLSSISSNIDLQQGTIKRGIDPQLDALKKTYDNLPHLLTVYARQQNWGSDIRIVFMSQIGYLIRVPHQIQVPKSQQDEWILQFIKNSGKFYCNQLTKTLDNQYGDIYGEITDREKKISFQLESIISEYCKIIEEAYWKCCQLQCFVTIAIISNGMCQPRLSSESLIISRGWHLLLAQDAIQNHGFSFNQDIAPRQKVFNSQQNLVNTHYSNRMMVITGPNGSGKTIYMKQLAIIFYLAHLGFYVPAQFAEIPLIDKIILVESKRSIYKGNNGFQSEISSLSKITTPGLLTNKSLILIDQLGASIQTIFAKKILTALIKYLSQSKYSNIGANEDLQSIGDKFNIPLSIIITHLTDIMSLNIINQNYFIRYLTMDMEKDETYLFKIKPGLVKKGYGIECAKAFMDKSFIKRAQKIWEDIKYKV